MIISDGFLFSRTLLVRDKLFRCKVEKHAKNVHVKALRPSTMSLNQCLSILAVYNHVIKLALYVNFFKAYS